MKRKDSTKNGKAARMAVALLIASLALAFGCGDKTSKEDKAKKALDEIVKSLVLYPDSQQSSYEVDEKNDALKLTYTTNENVLVLEQYFPKAIKEHGYTQVLDSQSMISYKDKTGRLVSIAWFSRDPDIFKYKSVYHIVVEPLPESMKGQAEQK